MFPLLPTAACVGVPARQRLREDRILVVIVLVLAVSLAVSGMTVATVLELLAGAGWIALRLTRPHSASAR
ncbi:hypothetical protein [Streptomyces sp. NPDC048248]|uniref:hypothetical protein n=1 Tax=Streptomyces sp. NPDC048248 TaxID=3365523 RepID=UPI00371F9CBB